jgi:hypothetical protein
LESIQAAVGDSDWRNGRNTIATANPSAAQREGAALTHDPRAEPRRQIARALQRTEAAITFKAFKLRLSLAQKIRPRRKTVRKAR